MTLEENVNISAQVGHRLDDLFGDADVSEMTINEKSESKESPLRDLKAIILSIDWEITDKVMNRLIEHVEKLRKVYRKNRIILLFLQLLETIGKYVQVYKGKAHPDAVKLLNAVYVNLEKVVQNKDMAQEEKKRILSAQIARFQKLKEQVKIRKTHAEKQKTMEPGSQGAQSVAPSPSSLPSGGGAAAGGTVKPVSGTSEIPDAVFQGPEAMSFLLKEIRLCIRSEFQMLREELKAPRS